MSEPHSNASVPKGFVLGDVTSSRPGVTCQEARRTDSDERYIIKTITLPSSQTQLDALLLTGAYPDADAAKDYYRALAEELERQVRVLDKLSAQRGFLDFSGCQITELTEGVGFDLTLIAPQRRSLEETLRTEPMTHRGAVNMAIDLCAALATCREAGYLYVDLKPANVFLSQEGDWRIGDLGFEKLTGLKYAVLPDRCRSPWTAPEIRDAYSALNTTMDIYALGLMLYQAYNYGRLPWKNEAGREALMAQLAEGGLMTAPANADFALSQIIQKACAYKPEDRWQTPIQMAQALIAYLNQTDPADEIIALLLPEEPEAEEVVAEEPAVVEQEAEVVSGEEPVAEAATEEEPAVETIAEEEPVSEIAAEEEPAAELFVEEEPAAEAVEEEAAAEAIAEEEPFLEVFAEEAPAAEEVSDEEDWLARMDALLAPEDEDGQALPSLRELLGDLPLPEEDLPEPEAEESAPVALAEPEKKGRFGWLIALIILGLIAAGLWFGYSRFIRQTIDDLSAQGLGDSMTVSVVTDMDESRLTVVCVDQYGSRRTAPLEDGQAVFTGLMPDTQYTISLEAEGLCVLKGALTTRYYTPQETRILSFSAATGPEDGSVLLTFDTDGPESGSWTITWAAEGAEPASASFNGHMHTVTGLTPGLEYTFTLSAQEGYHLSGPCTLRCTANSLVYAQHLTLAGNADGSITANWTAPADVTVSSWTARCYNDRGFDLTLTVSEPTATFTGIDPHASYTIEVVAEGMTQCTRTYVTADPITITDVHTEPFGEDSLMVTWVYEGNAPAGGWLLLYTVDQGTEQHVIQCPEASAVITPVVPGSHYDMTIQAAGAVSVFGGVGSADVPEAQVFDYFDMDATAVTMALARFPGEGWSWKTMDEEDFTSVFAVGKPMAVLLSTGQEIGQSDNTVTTMFVFRNDSGRVAQVFEVTRTWDEMWVEGHCDLTIPQAPLTPGDYTLQVYIDGKLLSNQDVIFE